MATTTSITRQLRSEGLPVELVRGEGYHYFAFDDGRTYETESVMCPRFNDLTAERWLADGRDFAARMAIKSKEAAESWPGNLILRRMGQA